MASDEDNELLLAYDMLKELKENMKTVQELWDDFKRQGWINRSLAQELSKDEVIVPKSSLTQLAIECEQMKGLIPRLVCQDIYTAAGKLASVEENLEKTTSERDRLDRDVTHWKTQLENTIAQAQLEKQANLDLQMDLQVLTAQMSQQTEFSSGLGATLGTLLWTLSRQEETVSHIINGPKSSELLQLTSSCVSSYLTAYKDDQWPEQITDEATFILALIGTITNLAASAVGRDHISAKPEGQRLVDTFLTFIAETPSGKCTNMKSLMLTALYNLSINQKGIRYLCGRPGIVQLLVRHLQDEPDTDNRVNCLRLLQSLVADEDSPHIVLQLKENLPIQFLQHLASSRHRLIKELSLDLLLDFRDGQVEQ